MVKSCQPLISNLDNFPTPTEWAVVVDIFRSPGLNLDMQPMPLLLAELQEILVCTVEKVNQQPRKQRRVVMVPKIYACIVFKPM